MAAKKGVPQLEALFSGCKQFNADVRYDPYRGHITILVWELGAHAVCEAQALSIQDEIKKRTAQYPQLVCYCFDPFSTLVYAV